MLRLTRSRAWADKLRAYRVLVDDEQIGEIRNGESKEFSVAPGEHTLTLKVDWCRSRIVPFTAPASGDVVFDCGTNIVGWKLLFATLYIIFKKNDYMMLKQRAA